MPLVELGVECRRLVLGIPGSWAEMKKLMGARWAHAHDFSKKLMGGLIWKKRWAHNGRPAHDFSFILMGVSKQKNWWAPNGRFILLKNRSVKQNPHVPPLNTKIYAKLTRATPIIRQWTWYSYFLPAFWNTINWFRNFKGYVRSKLI